MEPICHSSVLGRYPYSYMKQIVYILFLLAPLTALRGQSPLTADSLFDSNKLLEVEIHITQENWDTMRVQHHDLVHFLGPERLKEADPDVYDYVKADITINGHSFNSVGIRKKGLLGSSSFTRPSMKIKFDEYIKDQKIPGISRMTLNNNNQDATQLNQYLTYHMFRRAGVPAPRCNLAHVTLNGKSLGIYSHVESIRRDFLARQFADDQGHLYEGVVLADFADGQDRYFQAKSKKADRARGNISKIVEALESSDEDLLKKLEPLVDLEAFYRFWGMEELTGHWDGYTDNLNNYYIYRDPVSEKFHFIPWGADASFGQLNPFRQSAAPESVKAHGLLSRRLYSLPYSRERYRSTLKDLLETVWSEQAIFREIERMRSIFEAKLTVPDRVYQQSLAMLKQYVQTKRERIQGELDGPAPEWGLPPKKMDFMEKKGTITFSFDTNWETEPHPNPFRAKPDSLDIKLLGEDLTILQSGIRVMPQQRVMRYGQPNIGVLAITPKQGKMTIASLSIEPEFFKDEVNISVDGYTCAGWLVEMKLTDPNDISIIGILQGTLNLQKASTAPGGPVIGEVACDIYSILE